jgi:hypothetical protein
MKRTYRFLALALLGSLHASSMTVFAQSTPPKAPNPAKVALEKLKSLAGDWTGEIMTIPITFSVRTVSSGTAVMHEGHTEKGGPPNHEITMFYTEGERLLATHYCDAGNRTNMEGKLSEDGKTVNFSFIEVIGSKAGGYLKTLSLSMPDADTHSFEVLFVTPNGDSIPLKGEFKRAK